MGAQKKANVTTIESAQRKSAEVEEHRHEDSHEEGPLFGHAKKGEEGEGPWLVSYADMMTLLMGFFALIASFSKPDAGEFEKVASAASEYFGGEYESPYEKLAQQIRQIIKENQLEEQVAINVGHEGISMTFSGTIFFDSGEFQVKKEAIALMDKLSSAMKKESSEGGFNAMIEGHTDNVPISHPIIGSNWELSGIRAARIAQLFEKNGFSKEKLTIMGWGETRPLVSETNPDGTPNPTNRSKNRRVVIRIYKDLPK